MHLRAHTHFFPQREPWQDSLVVRYLGPELDLLFSFPCSTFPGCVILGKLPHLSVHFINVMDHSTHLIGLLCMLLYEAHT